MAITTDKTSEHILRRRMHGLYLSRRAGDISTLSHELLGLHCWFHRNVAFSALIRGAELQGWKTALTKTWLYRGTLHGVVYEDLPQLLSLHAGESYLGRYLGEELMRDISDEVVRLMEDGVFSRSEFRRIFAHKFDPKTVDALFSPWGGIFVYLAGLGKVAFRDMTSRDFDLISAEPALTPDEVLPELLRKYLAAYGPATLSDASWFLGLWKDGRKKLAALDLDEYARFEYGGNVYFCADSEPDTGEIPEMTLLSGFDPLIVSYAERSAVLPSGCKKAVILSSGICLPTIAVNGQVAGLWNIKKREPVLEFFADQPKRIRDDAFYLVDEIRRKTEFAI